MFITLAWQVDNVLKFHASCFSCEAEKASRSEYSSWSISEVQTWLSVASVYLAA